MTSAPAVVSTAPTAREAAGGTKATYAVFAGLGIAGSTWSSRLPQVRTQMHLGPSTGLAFAGTLLWGTGAALGFPVSMSAGADEPARAAGRVGVITSIGYCGFVGGQPLIGFLRNLVTVGHALLVVAILMVLSTAIAGATRRSPEQRPQTGSDAQAHTALT